MNSVPAKSEIEEAAEIEFSAVKRRSITGIATLIFRNYLLSAISLVGFTLITIFLKKEEFGTFIIVSAIVDFFGYFSDVGLAAALVQKPSKPTISELRSTFLTQQVLVSASVILILALTPLVRTWNNLGPVQIQLLYAVVFGFWLSSLKSIPSVILERRLEFQKLVFVQLVETIIFYFFVVFMAFRGAGLASYTVAVVARSVVGVALLYSISPWPIGFALEKESLKGLFRFGIPYQANTLLALVKDRLMTIFLGRLIGTSGVGLAGWAEKWANMPLRNFMDPVNTVTFPAYSRLQTNRAELGRVVGKALFFITALVYPAVIGMVVLSSWFVILVPRYAQWKPALLALGLYAVNALWSAPSTHLTNLLNSIGRIRWTFYLMIFWTALTWILTPVLAWKFGFTGVALSQAIIGSTSFITFWLARKEVPFSPVEIFKALAASLCMAVVLLVSRQVLAPSWPSLIVLIVGGAAVYAAVLLFLTGGTVIADAKALLLSLKKS